MRHGHSKQNNEKESPLPLAHTRARVLKKTIHNISQHFTTFHNISHALILAEQQLERPQRKKRRVTLCGVD
jgi:hypothetical protein